MWDGVTTLVQLDFLLTEGLETSTLPLMAFLPFPGPSVGMLSFLTSWPAVTQAQLGGDNVGEKEKANIPVSTCQRRASGVPGPVPGVVEHVAGNMGLGGSRGLIQILLLSHNSCVTSMAGAGARAAKYPMLQCPYL